MRLKQGVSFMLSLNIKQVGVFNKYTQGIKQTWSTSSASTSLQNGGGRGDIALPEKWFDLTTMT